MEFTDAFVVASDAVITPASDFDEETRARLNCDLSHFVVRLEGARNPGQVVDGHMRALLTVLSRPTRLVDAVIAVARASAEDPEALLDAAIPGFLRLIDSGVLQPADGPPRRVRGRTLLPGDSFASFTAVTCIQALDDSEVYQARSGSGDRLLLKIARPGTETGSETGNANIRREASILARLRDAPVPALLESGEWDGRVYVAIEWVQGTDADIVAAEYRRLQPGARQQLAASLCVSIATAYEHLHAARIVHGDVHERNLLIDRDGDVTLIDFGLARHLDDDHPPPRAGAAFYFEPEFARARVAGARLPPASALGEQFLVGAMLYSLVAGCTYADFSYDADLAFRQIASPIPRTFASCGVPPWPDLESVLQRALASDPAARYPSMADFAEALCEVARRADSRAERVASSARPLSPAATRLDRMIDALATSPALLERGVQRAPTASYAYGAAGVSLALLQLSYAQDDPRLLAMSDLWSHRALHAARYTRTAFFADDDEISERHLGPASLLFSRPGVCATATLVAQARCDLVAMECAIDAFVRSVRGPARALDFASGAPGNLLGCSRLLSGTPRESRGWARLRATGDRMLNALWNELDQMPPIANATGLVNLGIAHGWGGVLYASLAWSAAIGTPPPEMCGQRLEELAALAESHGRGMRYPWRDFPEGASDPRPFTQYMSGWCNGSAGLFFLWLEAATAFHRPRYLELAEALAWNVWEDEADDEPSLCCGLAGRVFALLAMYRSSGDDVWLLRASLLTARGAEAIEDDELDVGLLKGHLGLALAQRGLQRPELARMPLFESDGWSA